MSQNRHHQPVLLDEAIEALSVRADGVYLDCTFGRGGHAGEILARLGPAGRLIGIDRDPEAVTHAMTEFGDRPGFLIVHASFSELRLALDQASVDGVDGVLMDLGVSSPQLDDASRGFSFQAEGPLDMRMDPGSGPSAADWLADADEQEIARVLWEYGEERQSRRIARAIVRRRQSEPLRTTADLADLVAAVLGRRHGDKHPATRTFQAIRIHINGELDALDAGLEQAVEALLAGGRLVVISFHSLEDRRVKQFIRRESSPPAGNRRLPVPAGHPLRLRRIGGAVKPGSRELERNPRARSAVMRVAERLP